MSSIITSRIRAPHIPTVCPFPSCKQEIEFALPSPAPKSGSTLKIRCCKCQTVFDYPYNTSNPGSASDNTSRKTRMIGTQDRPLETEYYELLGVSIDATTEDIKRAYRRLAIQHHPDKNPNDPSAQARFQAISSAYQVLSDPVTRKKYNEFGASKDVATTVMDPEEVFGQIFGGEKFEDIFGKISLARDMKTALQEAEDEEGSSNRISNGKTLTEDEKKKKEEKDKKKAAEKSAQRAERVSKLVANLSRKLAVFTESANGPNDAEITRSFRTICEIEAESLSHESYGPALLHTIGLTYTHKAKTFLASSSSATTILGLPTFGVGGWIKNVQGKWDTFSDTVSTLRAALDLKSTFEALQAAEKNGNLTDEQRKKLEEQAAEKGLDALFKGTKLEIQSILRETCDIILSSPSPSNTHVPPTPQQANLRAFALNILGEAYLKWGNSHVDHKDPSSNTNTRSDSPSFSDSDYVRVDKKSNR